MNFQDEMKQKFLEVAAGKAEPGEWQEWWNSHRSQLEKALTRGDQVRIMPALWNPDYYWMRKTQSGISYYFHGQGRPVKCSDYYEKKAQEEEICNRQKALEEFHRSTALARQGWEQYLEAHPVKAVDFDWKVLIGTPPGQKPVPVFSYKHVRTTEQWKESIRELKLRLMENMQAKIAPLAKAYGMKKAGTNTFVRERNGLVSFFRFVGYFRGGGYENMYYYLAPIYGMDEEILGLPGCVCHGESYQRMHRGWGVIESGMDAVDDVRVEQINQKFDEILTFLAEEIFPEWQKIDCLETYFAKERQDYRKATEKGPIDPKTNRPMWNLRPTVQNHPWRADDYLFGVWDLLSGREGEGYERLKKCLKHNKNHVKERLKERPGAYNDKREPIPVLYHNAELFVKTELIADTKERRRVISETYEEVCRFMRYYHGLTKRVER